MVRFADKNDAEQLIKLNIEFNGQYTGALNITKEYVEQSLENNTGELVIVSEENGIIVGFICVQLKKSFCFFGLYMPEITEVYVSQDYRRQGHAASMIRFAEEYIQEKYRLHGFQVLTWCKNQTAQSTYKKLGYEPDEEIHLSKKSDKTED